MKKVVIQNAGRSQSFINRTPQTVLHISNKSSWAAVLSMLDRAVSTHKSTNVDASTQHNTSQKNKDNSCTVRCLKMDECNWYRDVNKSDKSTSKQQPQFVAQIPQNIHKRLFVNLTKLVILKCGLTNIEFDIKYPQKGSKKTLPTLSSPIHSHSHNHKSIVIFPNLQQLDISQNQLSCIPSFVYTCGKLTKLYVHHNKITRLQTRMSQLKHLTYINMKANVLEELSAYVCLWIKYQYIKVQWQWNMNIVCKYIQAKVQMSTTKTTSIRQSCQNKQMSSQRQTSRNRDMLKTIQTQSQQSEDIASQVPINLSGSQMGILAYRKLGQAEIQQYIHVRQMAMSAFSISKYKTQYLQIDERMLRQQLQTLLHSEHLQYIKYIDRFLHKLGIPILTGYVNTCLNSRYYQTMDYLLCVIHAVNIKQYHTHLQPQADSHQQEQFSQTKYQTIPKQLGSQQSINQLCNHQWEHQSGLGTQRNQVDSRVVDINKQVKLQQMNIAQPKLIQSINEGKQINKNKNGNKQTRIANLTKKNVKMLAQITNINNNYCPNIKDKNNKKPKTKQEQKGTKMQKQNEESMRNSEAKPINQINNTNKVKLTAFNSNYQRNRNKINIEDSSDNKIIKMNKRIKQRIQEARLKINRHQNKQADVSRQSKESQGDHFDYGKLKKQEIGNAQDQNQIQQESKTYRTSRLPNNDSSEVQLLLAKLVSFNPLHYSTISNCMIQLINMDHFLWLINQLQYTHMNAQSKGDRRSHYPRATNENMQRLKVIFKSYILKTITNKLITNESTLQHLLNRITYKPAIKYLFMYTHLQFVNGDQYQFKSYCIVSSILKIQDIQLIHYMLSTYYNFADVLFSHQFSPYVLCPKSKNPNLPTPNQGPGHTHRVNNDKVRIVSNKDRHNDRHAIKSAIMTKSITFSKVTDGMMACNQSGSIRNSCRSLNKDQHITQNRKSDQFCLNWRQVIKGTSKIYKYLYKKQKEYIRRHLIQNQVRNKNWYFPEYTAGKQTSSIAHNHIYDNITYKEYQQFQNGLGNRNVSLQLKNNKQNNYSIAKKILMEVVDQAKSQIRNIGSSKSRGRMNRHKNNNSVYHPVHSQNNHSSLYSNMQEKSMDNSKNLTSIRTDINNSNKKADLQNIQDSKHPQNKNNIKLLHQISAFSQPQPHKIAYYQSQYKHLNFDLFSNKKSSSNVIHEQVTQRNMKSPQAGPQKVRSQSVRSLGGRKQKKSSILLLSCTKKQQKQNIPTQGHNQKYIVKRNKKKSGISVFSNNNQSNLTFKNDIQNENYKLDNPQNDYSVHSLNNPYFHENNKQNQSHHHINHRTDHKKHQHYTQKKTLYLNATPLDKSQIKSKAETIDVNLPKDISKASINKLNISSKSSEYMIPMKSEQVSSKKQKRQVVRQKEEHLRKEKQNLDKIILRNSKTTRQFEARDNGNSNSSLNRKNNSKDELNKINSLSNCSQIKINSFSGGSNNQKNNCNEDRFRFVQCSTFDLA